jgi:hypothetical protein
MQTKLDWTILLSRDVRASMDFYSVATGWRFEPLPGPPYPCWVARSPGGTPVAVFVDASASDFPDATELWLPYFTVGDLDRCVLEAEKLGATILRTPFEIPGFGRVALLRQPGGSIAGWRTPAPPPDPPS